MTAISFQPFPTLNACLNFMAGVFLIIGWRAIKAGNSQLHKKMMLAAFTASVLFLCSYVTYHLMFSGITKYQGKGIGRIIYFSILLTHTPLATLIVPFCLLAVYYGLKQDFQKHVRITKWLWPVWIYVSVTGVLIYFMLYLIPPF